MKRIIAAVMLLAMALGVSLWGQWQMRRDLTEITEIVETLRTQAEDEHSAATETAETLRERWDIVSRRLCLILNHTALGECQRIIALLPQLCREEHTADILRACELLQYQLEHLVHSETLQWENVF